MILIKKMKSSLLFLIILLMLVTTLFPVCEVMAANSPETAPTTNPEPQPNNQPTVALTAPGKATTFQIGNLKCQVATYTETSVQVTGVKQLALDNKQDTTKPITIPDAVTKVGKSYAVTSIGDGAFQGSKVKAVTLSKSVTALDKNAFGGSKVQTLTVKSVKLNRKTVGKAAFNSQLKTIKVPKSKLGEYKKVFQATDLSKKVKIKAF